MDWTGGRLQRYSNNSRSAALSAAQKKGFAKSRAKVSKGKRHDLPLQGFSQFMQLQESEIKQQMDKRTGDIANESTCKSSIHPELHKTSYLDRVKRKLLDRTDWAAVSASRPLKMRFTPIAELETFGKRRRLTDADRSRLAYYSKVPPTSAVNAACSKRRRYTTRADEVDSLDIAMKDLPAGADEDIGTSKSSQPMLLDTESLYVRNGLNPKTARNVSMGFSQLAASAQCPASFLTVFSSPSQNLELSPSRILQSGIEGLDNRPIPRQEFSARLLETSSPCILSSNNSQHMRPAVRRFTIDDQALSQQEWLQDSNSVRSEMRQMHYQRGKNNEPMTSYVRTQPSVRESSISVQDSPWPQHPIYSIRRDVNRKMRSPADFADAGLSRGKYNKSHVGPVFARSVPSVADRLVPAGEIFGQPITH